MLTPEGTIKNYNSVMENIPLPVNNPAGIIRIVIFKRALTCSFQW
jgi:hypothetical protein